MINALQNGDAAPCDAAAAACLVARARRAEELSLRDLQDLVRYRRNLLVKRSIHCRYGAVLDGEKLYRWFAAHGWNNGLARVSLRLRCSRCRARPESVRVTSERVNGPAWGPRSEANWVAAMKRARD